MSWPFLAVVFSGWLYIDAAYRGPNWQRYLFRPLTLLLLLLWTWQAKAPDMHNSLIVVALAASLCGDILSSLPGERRFYSIGAWIVGVVVYTFNMTIPPAFAFNWLLLATLLVAGGGLLLLLRNSVEQTLRLPTSLWLAAGLVMVWIAAGRYLVLGGRADVSLLVGSILLLVSSVVWLINHYRYPFKAANGVIACLYFIGHFMMVRSLYLA